MNIVTIRRARWSARPRRVYQETDLKTAWRQSTYWSIGSFTVSVLCALTPHRTSHREMKKRKIKITDMNNDFRIDKIKTKTTTTFVDNWNTRKILMEFASIFIRNWKFANPTRYSSIWIGDQRNRCREYVRYLIRCAEKVKYCVSMHVTNTTMSCVCHVFIR